MSKFLNLKSVRFASAVSLAVVATLTPAAMASASGSSALNFNFDTAGQLNKDFTSYVSYGTVNQSASGGIGDSGAITTNNDSAGAVFQPKASYTIGPVGSSYSFSAMMQSVGNSGYSGFGFTATTPSAGNDTDSIGPFRPVDALGISVHGGGFVFHNGSNDINGSWQSGGGDINQITAYNDFDLLNSGSPDDWYNIIYTITRTSETEFTTRVEVWSANADGTLIRPGGADAVYEMVNQENSTILNSTRLYSYINFSGYRVNYFDNFKTTVSGGAQIVGAPAGSVTGDQAEEFSSDNSNTDDNGSLAGTGTNDAEIMALGSMALAALWIGMAVLGARRRSESK
jgi:hypothetical protein